MGLIKWAQLSELIKVISNNLPQVQSGKCFTDSISQIIFLVMVPSDLNHYLRYKKNAETRGHMPSLSPRNVLTNAYCKDVIYRQGKKISVSSEAACVSTEIDGDPGPALPVQINVIPHAVNVMVPEGAKPAGIRTRIVRAIG